MAKVKANKEDPVALKTATTLFQASLIEAGYDMPDPSQFAKSIYGLMSKQVGVNPDAEIKDIEIPDKVEEEETEDEDKKDKKDKKDEDKDDEKPEL